MKEIDALKNPQNDENLKSTALLDEDCGLNGAASKPAAAWKRMDFLKLADDRSSASSDPLDQCSESLDGNSDDTAHEVNQRLIPAG